ncbi:hypothetical protein GPECTOR_45g117 [Gonium pectorale]|uniref:Uncharacterized protein n=1 Tax=Gonium pectorale TaxID=33097 RepID=A0A150G8S5_GONPE|nr:hypothetical protein GPECTOR_45g117 [Gonium pectorale]|eukprot:KXZ46247.1 hypothetical protein GPECTOR_45g117 [Gonium pectorale]
MDLRPAEQGAGQKVGGHSGRAGGEGWRYQSTRCRRDADLLEFKFAPDGAAVAFRSEARTAVAPPPFCWTPGCISGPGNRGRLEALRDGLGWSSMETDEDKKWVQILLHD